MVPKPCYGCLGLKQQSATHTPASAEAALLSVLTLEFLQGYLITQGTLCEQTLVVDGWSRASFLVARSPRTLLKVHLPITILALARWIRQPPNVRVYLTQEP